jgi:nucleoside-triphosphatase THEP1
MHDSSITILTGAIHSGKTSYLIKEYSGKGKVYGILTPVVDSERSFQNIATGERFVMEAIGEEESFSVGRYKFSKDAFAKAISILEDALHQKEGILILDEIGPLELKGDGFYEVAKKIVAGSNPQLKKIIVVRSTILEEAISFFKIRNYKIIKI